jgi:uncharacterized protein YbjT (DUF2867 family)
MNPDASHSPSRIALLAGATGLVGGQLLMRLLESPAYTEVRALVRRAGSLPSHPKLREIAIDWEKLAAPSAAPDDRIAGDDVFCALGTTIRKARSPAAFRRVDLDYVAALARIARARGARKFLLVSSIGADAGSRLLYPRTKGEAERAVREVGLPETHVFRPSLLAGARAEFRAAERLALLAARPLGFLMTGPLRRYRPTPAGAVARAMLTQALTGTPGHHLHEAEAMEPEA